MNSLSDPFDLKKRLGEYSKPRFSIIPLIDLIFITLLIAFLSSKFIFAPGLSIDLPQSQQEQLEGSPSLSVITVTQSNSILFEVNIYSLSSINEAFTGFIESNKHPNPVLLAKFHKGVPTNILFSICEKAKAAGFKHIQLAGSPNTNTNNFFAVNNNVQ